MEGAGSGSAGAASVAPWSGLPLEAAASVACEAGCALADAIGAVASTGATLELAATGAGPDTGRGETGTGTGTAMAAGRIGSAASGGAEGAEPRLAERDAGFEERPAARCGEEGLEAGERGVSTAEGEFFARSSEFAEGLAILGAEAESFAEEAREAPPGAAAFAFARESAKDCDCEALVWPAGRESPADAGIEASMADASMFIRALVRAGGRMHAKRQTRGRGRRAGPTADA